MEDLIYTLIRTEKNNKEDPCLKSLIKNPNTQIKK